MFSCHKIKMEKQLKNMIFCSLNAIFVSNPLYTPTFIIKKVQYKFNIITKLHYAIHGHTAAELIVSRADANKEHMGLTTWENAPDGKIVKTDVSIAKNYLKSDELDSLGRVVNAFLELAENRAKRHIPMTMEDWAKHIDRFLSIHG